MMESSVVLNVVWTGTVFEHLQRFVASQVVHSSARFRFVANACEPGQIAAMEQFGLDHPDRVVEILEVSADRMVRHGDALDTVFRTRDDGTFFAFIDPDIVARGAFLGLFLETLEAHDAVTSGREVWSDHNIRPADHPGVNGEYFFDQDGFVFGSPHLALYRREPLHETMNRWDVGFSSSGNDLEDRTRRRLEAMGRSYWVYDTAKVVNILLQGDGGSLVHVEHPDLVHIGGVAHFLAPPSSAPAARNEAPAWGEGADWGEVDGMQARYEVARYTADVVGALGSGEAAAPIPTDADRAMCDRLSLVRTTLIELFETVKQPPGYRAGTGSSA